MHTFSVAPRLSSTGELPRRVGNRRHLDDSTTASPLTSVRPPCRPSQSAQGRTHTHTHTHMVRLPGTNRHLSDSSCQPPVWASASFWLTPFFKTTYFRSHRTNFVRS
ncbi:unnamed protein product [Protopolystoma xenopodis]|uniref:Uncharacterized protein n=1 Tax=Protopolystoma xenopodis TaxID=117903 RepID=A0A3S5CMK3_9PLAT|nr:unnamed protein product [Protopolystoma xenopodis]